VIHPMKRVLLLSLLGIILLAGSAQAASITLTWTDNATNEDGIEIERCQGANCTSFAKVGATLPANTQSHVDSSLPEGVLFRYRVRAINTAGVSGYSNIAEATTLRTIPAAPSSAVATPTLP